MAWHFYNAQGQELFIGATGATGPQGPAGVGGGVGAPMVWPDQVDEMEWAMPGARGADGQALIELDGGDPVSIYGGITPIDCGTP
jgi:hypothetical protein